MSDALILGIVQAIIGGLIVWYQKWRAHISDELTKEKAAASDALTIAKAIEVKKEVSDVKETVDTVKTQTDGMHTELVATRQQLGEALGKEIGRAEQKAETDAGNTKIAQEATPIKVEVVNEPLKVITPKEDKKEG